jgi:hypothetical protein
VTSDHHSDRRWAWVLTAAIIAAGYVLTLKIFYPGIMTYDARYVHSYIATWNMGDWQSPVMTVLWAVIDPIAPGAASMFLLTATLYWLGFTVMAFALLRRSFKAAIIMAALGLAPPAFMIVGTIWRDVLFAVVWFLAAGLAFAVAERRDRLRYAAQVVAFGLLALGLLLRPNALFATPILAGYLIWPTRFDLRRTALLYLPALIIAYALVPAVYYGVLGAKRQNALHSILVFDLGGITHFTKENQFPVTWSQDQERQLTDSCYDPAAWDYYWTIQPCTFVMARLEHDKVFGSSELVAAWRQAVLNHPMAYLRHRFAAMGTFLLGNNQVMWTVDIEDPKRPLFAENPWFVALKAMHDVLKPTPLFRAGTWLLCCAALCALAWWRRGAPSGAFIIGICGSAVVYIMTFLPFGVAADFRYAHFAVLAGLAGTVVLLAHAKDSLTATRPLEGAVVP